MLSAAERATRILLVEDSDIDMELLTAHLEKAELHFEIVRVVRRQEFIDALGEPHIDVVLADYSLPDFDGLSALNLSKSLRPELPFIFVSGVVGEEFATNAVKRGATDYVVKRNLSRLPAAVSRALGEARDRLAKVRAEEEVRTLNATLEAKVEERTAERDGIWRLSRDLFAVIDRDGKILASNPAWGVIFGYDEASVLKFTLRELTHPDDVDVARGQAAPLFQQAGAEDGHFEMRMRRRDGVYRWISWTAAQKGDAFYVVGRDVTDARHDAAELATAHQNLVNEIKERQRIEATMAQMQRLEAVGQLTSGVAHDFNNLLTVVLGNIAFVEKAATSGGDAKLAQRSQHIRMAAERGANLTKQLLAFSRSQVLEPKVVDLNDAVSSMQDLLQSTLGGSVRLETNLRPGLWPAFVDRTQIEMVVLNLSINARDAMPNGGELTVATRNVSITVPPKRPEEPAVGEYVCLTVTDSGTGMTEDVLSKALEPFFTTKGPGKGSGLGLAQVYGFAKQSGGGIRIVTRVDEGTAISVYLPRAHRTEDGAEARSDVVVGMPARAAGTVLVVDDDDNVRQVTSDILSDLGYSITTATDGQNALDILEKQSFDLMLIDFSMPGLNGVETALQAAELRPEMPVLFLSGYADKEAMRGIGETELLQKPYTTEALHAKVRAAMGKPTRASNSVVAFPVRK